MTEVQDKKERKAVLILEVIPQPWQDMIRALQAENERLRVALEPFAFFDKDEPDTTQEAWELRYLDRFKDWVGFEDIEAARAALEATT